MCPFGYQSINQSVHLFIYTHNFNNRELTTTVTEENDIAKLAIHGWRVIPKGTNTPAAKGRPIKL